MSTLKLCLWTHFISLLGNFVGRFSSSVICQTLLVQLYMFCPNLLVGTVQMFVSKFCWWVQFRCRLSNFVGSVICALSKFACGHISDVC